MVSLGATADYSLSNAAATSSAAASSLCSNRSTRESFLPKFSFSISWDSQTKSAHQSINLEQVLDAAVQCIRAADAIAYTQTTCSTGAMPTPQSWQQKLNNGEVTLNGVTATGSESVTLGQTLVWNRPPWIEPESPQHFEVLFEDPHLLAVNKPSGLPTLPGGGFMENTLLRLVQKQTPSANPVHRLGRATTGIVLFAKTSQAASKLSANWTTPT